MKYNIRKIKVIQYYVYFILLFLVRSAQISDEDNKIPLVAIVSSPQNDYHSIDFMNGVPTSIVRWVEQTGCHAIIIPHNINELEIQFVLSKVSGLILPPHHSFFRKNSYTKLTKYSADIKRFVMKSIEIMSLPGATPFPILAIQEGMASQVLSLTSDPKIPMKNFNKKNTVCETKFDWTTITKSVFFARIQFKDLRNIYYDYSQEYFCRGKLTSKTSFKNYQNIEGFSGNDFNIHISVLDRTLTKELEDLEYVSVFEHKIFPIFGINFNPSQFAVLQESTAFLRGKNAVEFSADLAHAFKKSVKEKFATVEAPDNTIHSFGQELVSTPMLNWRKKYNGLLKELIEVTSFPNDYLYTNKHASVK